MSALCLSRTVKYSLTRLEVTCSVSRGGPASAAGVSGTVLTGGASGDGAACPHVHGTAAVKNNTKMLKTRTAENPDLLDGGEAQWVIPGWASRALIILSIRPHCGYHGRRISTR